MELTLEAEGAAAHGGGVRQDRGVLRLACAESLGFGGRTLARKIREKTQG